MKFLKISAIFTALALMTGCAVVKEGDTGVQRMWGKMDHTETGTGLELYNPFTTDFFKMSVREIPIELDDLHPKAGDNLSMLDLDITVYYKANPNQVSEIYTSYQNGSLEKDGVWYPGYNIVYNAAREAAYKAVSQFDSLVIHRSRDAIAEQIIDIMQKTPIVSSGDIDITRVIIRAADTDPSIEESIQKNIKREKELEAKEKEIQIAKADAQIEIEQARGVAEANIIINDSLTDAYLQHEQNKALMAFARSGKHSTVVIPSNFTNSSLLIDATTSKQ